MPLFLNCGKGNDRERERETAGGQGSASGGLHPVLHVFWGGQSDFPPNIAAQAGTQTWPAMLGLALSAVGLPVLGVVAVARSGGLDALGSRVHPAFARVFTIVAYLAIGPCLAIPRTATTSFEMAVPPFVERTPPSGCINWSTPWCSSPPPCSSPCGRRSRRPAGKILCPILVALIVVTFVGCLVNPLEGYGPATGDYATHAVVKGFIEGYQTMDTIAALAFGIVIAVNIRARGVEEEGAVVQVPSGRGWSPEGCCCGLLHAGPHRRPCPAAHSPTRPTGRRPSPMWWACCSAPWAASCSAGIFLIACFNVCVGLISSCGEYFHSICPRLSYRGWAVLFALVSMAISNAGLTQILEVSAPVLSAIYPVAIVLIALSFFQRWLEGRRWVYPAAVLCTGVFSVLFACKGSEGASGLSGRPAPGGRRPGLGAPCRGGRRSWGPAALRPKTTTSAVPAGTALVVSRRPLAKPVAFWIQQTGGGAGVRRRFRVNRRSRWGGRNATSRRRR